MTPPPVRDCRACGAAILFAYTTNDKIIPVDADPDAGGNVRLINHPTGLRAQVLGPLELQLAEAEGEELFWPHFATCPNADEFRKRRE